MRVRLFIAGAMLAALPAVQAFTYRSDSGVSDNSIGVGGGGNIAWMQAFSVTGGNNSITSISTTFGTPAFPNESGVVVGQTFKVYLWRGTPNGTGADLPTLLAQASATVAAGTIDTDVFQTVAISGTVTGTSNFFIGASVNHATARFPAPLQGTNPPPSLWPILTTSWTAGSITADGFDPNNLTGGIGLFQNSASGIAGNYLIRAEAVPEPLTMITMAGAIGALALRRRRKKA